MVPTTAPAKDKAAAVAVAGFTQSARADYIEPFIDASAVPGAAAVRLPGSAFELPAFGYLRHVDLLVEATGGTGAVAVMKADAPWSVLGEVTLTDSNGQPIVGPLTGYDLYLVNLFGGYAFDADPLRSPAYTAPSTDGNFKFLLRVPVEITARDGLGALANQNAASAYKLTIGVADLASVYSTNPTTVPSVRVRGYMEAWTQPANGSQPPYLGTTQVWSKEGKGIAASGFSRHPLSRVGNAIRNLILVTRDAAGARVSTILPDPVVFKLDSRQLQNVPPALVRARMAERYGYTGSQLPTGVYAFDFCSDFDGHPGGELRDQWLRTTSASRIEFEGAYGAVGRVELLVNDVLAFAGGVPGHIGTEA